MSDYTSHSQNRTIRRLISAAFFDATHSVIDTHEVIKVLAIAVTANLGAFAMLRVANDRVVEFLEENGPNVLIYAAIFFFFAGFFIGFACYRFLANRWPHSGAGILSGPRRSSRAPATYCSQ